jgi:hypothetical protein
MLFENDSDFYKVSELYCNVNKKISDSNFALR